MFFFGDDCVLLFFFLSIFITDIADIIDIADIADTATMTTPYPRGKKQEHRPASYEEYEQTLPDRLRLQARRILQPVLALFPHSHTQPGLFRRPLPRSLPRIQKRPAAVLAVVVLWLLWKLLGRAVEDGDFVPGSVGQTSSHQWPNNGYHANLPALPTRIQAHDPFIGRGAAHSAETMLEYFVAYGKLPIGHGVDLSMYRSIDGLYFWVNGSDPRHALARAFYSNSAENHFMVPPQLSTAFKEGLSDVTFWDIGLQTAPDTSDDVVEFGEEEEHAKIQPSAKTLQNTNNRFRDNGEFRYSLRSARMHFGRSLRTQHVVTTDFWATGFPNPDVNDHPDNGPDGTEMYETIIEEWRASFPDEEEPGSSLHGPTFAIEGGLKRVSQYPQWMDSAVQERSRNIRFHNGE